MEEATTMTAAAPALEPSNHLHRPTSAKTQDVGHILSKQFGEQFIREAIDPQVVQNLRVSQRGSSDPYHEEFLSKLLAVVDSRQRRLDKLAQLERSIMAAKARAMLADERLANRLHSGRAGYPELGLPAPSSHFRACLDAELLRNHGLIGPTDLVSRVPPPVPPPSAVAKSDLVEPLQRKRTAASAGSGASSGAGKRSSRLWSATSQQQQRGDSKLELLEADADEEAEKVIDEASNVSEGSYRMPSAPRQKSPRQKKIEKLAKRKNLNWQEECSTEGRGEARKILANMESRVGYLPNPKFLLPMEQGGNGNLLTGKLVRDPADIRIFVSNPEKIVFSDYQIGQVYQQSLELRNISCAMRYVRAIPPRSQYFSLSLGQFPGEFGEVAPGLCARYDVSFAPDSLRDFEDEIAIETQATGVVLTVRIEARRPRPVLTIPSELDIGQCLVYGSKTVYLRLSNEGGDGSFVILRSDQWPATNLKRTVQGDSVNDGIFELRPSCFSLPRGAATTLEVTFNARGVEIFKSEFFVVCDNCQAKELLLIGEGQRPAVAIVGVDPPGVAEPKPGESTDAGAEALLRFEPAHPFTYCQRSLTLKNLANVELPFEWKTVKPFCRPPVTEEVGKEDSLPGHRTLDADSPFTVEPEFGLLGASASQEFVVTFAPSLVGEFHSALHLLLLEVPLGPSEQQQQQQQPGASSNGALQALELECKAVCEPLRVRLEPSALQIPGDILVGTTIRQRLRLFNASRAPVSFAWDSVADSASIVELEPRTGSIEAGASAAIDLCLTGTRPAQLDYSLACQVQHLDEPLLLRVLASVRGVQIQLQQPDVNFGLLEVGKLAEKQLRLLNPYQLECHWTVQPGPNCELRFEPFTSRLGPLEEQLVTVRYRPSQPQTLNEVFRIDVANGESTFVSAFAEVQSPAVCILDAEKLLEIQDLYLDVKSAYTVRLYNQTRLRCRFEWQSAAGLGDVGQLCEASVEPRSGWLEPRQSLPITVFVRPKIIARLESLLIPCQVEGQDSPVVLELSGNMKGISVTYHCSEKLLDSQEGFPVDEFGTAQRVDFGTVPVHGVSKRYLHIRNNTSIRAGFSMDVEFFKAVPPETEVILPVERSQAAAQRTSSNRNSLLTKTPNLADPKSKPFKHAFYDMCKLYLRQNKGAAVHCSPHSGTLEAYSVTTIELTAYNDMWGSYTDSLLVSVEALPIQAVPVALTVNGCPVIFTMTAGRPDQAPILRFGSHTHGSKSVTRPVRLNNRSPFALRLDWRVFNIQPGDDQLLDLLCDFGRQFPPLDANGEEILPPVPTGADGEDDPAGSHRPATGALPPDSPDTSAAPSRLTGVADDDDADEKPRPPSPPPLRPVVINVRPHEGRPALAPFRVSPEQLTLHPESYDYVHVTFDSNSIDTVTEAMDFSTYLLAFMSLDEERAQVPGKVSRGTGHGADQLRLDVTGSIVCPELDVDYNNDDGFAFNSAASDLLLMPLPAAAPESIGPAKTAFATLRNLRDTPLSFHLYLDAPFGIVQPKSAAAAASQPHRPMPDEDKDAGDEAGSCSVGWSAACGPISLTPRQTCLLEVGFTFDWTMLPLLRQTPEKLQAKGVGLTTNDATGERCLKFQGRLLMKFANGTDQSLPLSACLRLPSLAVSQTVLDFGVCMVGQRRELNFTLLNSTASGSKWSAKLVHLSDTCEQSSTFTFTPENGYLDGNITYLSRNKMLIKVFFTPKHAESYSADMEFRGVLEEEVRVVRIIGSGSYDEQYKTIYNE